MLRFFENTDSPNIPLNLENAASVIVSQTCTANTILIIIEILKLYIVLFQRGLGLLFGDW